MGGGVLAIGTVIASYPAEYPVTNTIYCIMQYVPWVYVAMFWHIIGAWLMLVAFIEMAVIKRVLSWKYFQFLGKISYEIYVVGFVIQNSYFAWFFLKLNEKGYYGTAFVCASISAILLIIGIAYGLNKMIVCFGKKISGFGRGTKVFQF